MATLEKLFSISQIKPGYRLNMIDMNVIPCHSRFHLSLDMGSKEYRSTVQILDRAFSLSEIAVANYFINTLTL